MVVLCCEVVVDRAAISSSSAASRCEERRRGYGRRRLMRNLRLLGPVYDRSRSYRAAGGPEAPILASWVMYSMSVILLIWISSLGRS